MAGPYLYVAINGNIFAQAVDGIVIWDTSTDTQAGYVLHQQRGFDAPWFDCCVSGDSSTFLTRGFSGVATINAATLAAGIVTGTGSRDNTFGSSQVNIASSADGSTYYIADKTTRLVRKVDTATGNVLQTSAVALPNNFTFGATLSRDESLLFIGSTMRVLNTSDLTTAYSTPFIAQSHSVQGFSPAGDIAYYRDSTTGNFIAFTTTTGTTLNTVAIPHSDFATSGAFAVTNDGTKAYLITKDGTNISYLYAIDLAAFTISLVATYGSGGIGYAFAAMTPDSAYLYVSNGNATISKLRLSDGVKTDFTVVGTGYTSTATGACACRPIAGPAVTPPPPSDCCAWDRSETPLMSAWDKTEDCTAATVTRAGVPAVSNWMRTETSCT